MDSDDRANASLSEVDSYSHISGTFVTNGLRKKKRIYSDFCVTFFFTSSVLVGMDILSIVETVDRACRSFVTLVPPFLDITEFLNMKTRLRLLREQSKCLAAAAQKMIEQARIQRASFARLPKDVLSMSLTWLNFHVAMSLTRVCKRWHHNILADKDTLHLKSFGTLPKGLREIPLAPAVRGVVDHLRDCPHILQFGPSQLQIHLWDGCSHFRVSVSHDDQQVIEVQSPELLADDIKKIDQSYDNFFADVDVDSVVCFNDRQYMHSNESTVFVCNLTVAPKHFAVASILDVDCLRYVDTELINWCLKEKVDKERPGQVTQTCNVFWFTEVAVSSGKDPFVVTVVARSCSYDDYYTFVVIWKAGQKLTSLLIPIPCEEVTCVGINEVLIGICSNGRVDLYTHSGRACMTFTLRWTPTEILMTDDLLVCYQEKEMAMYRFV